MGRRYPTTPDPDSDDASIGRNASDRSLLGTVSGGDKTRRIQVDDQGRLVVSTVTSSATVKEKRFDYDTRVDSNPVYIGEADPGTLTTATAWTVYKFTYDATSRVTRIQVQSNIAWDSRTAGW